MYNYTREYGRNNPYEEEYSYVKIIPLWGEKAPLKRALKIDSKGRVTERECDRLLTDSQPKGCEGSTPSPSTILYHTYSSSHPECAVKYTMESLEEFVNSLEGKYNPLDIEIIVKG